MFLFLSPHFLTENYSHTLPTNCVSLIACVYTFLKKHRAGRRADEIKAGLTSPRYGHSTVYCTSL